MPPVDKFGIGLDPMPEELVHEPALADPRDADERDALRLLLGAGPGERVEKHVKLPPPPDERRARLERLDAHA